MNTIWLTSKFNPVKIRDKEELDGNDKSYFFLRNLSKLPLTFQEFWTLIRVFFKFIVLIVSFLTSSNHIAGNIYFLWKFFFYRTGESLDLNAGNDEVVERQAASPRVELGQQVLDERRGEPVTHLRESWKREK
jgi:hypothetical protein